MTVDGLVRDGVERVGTLDDRGRLVDVDLGSVEVDDGGAPARVVGGRVGAGATEVDVAGSVARGFGFTVPRDAAGAGRTST